MDDTLTVQEDLGYRIIISKWHPIPGILSAMHLATLLLAILLIGIQMPAGKNWSTRVPVCLVILESYGLWQHSPSRLLQGKGTNEHADSKAEAY